MGLGLGGYIAILASLATDIADPLERLKTIIESSRAAKELSGSLKAAIPTDFPSFGAPWIMGGFALLFGRSRISDNLPPLANVAITQGNSDASAEDADIHALDAASAVCSSWLSPPVCVRSRAG